MRAWLLDTGPLVAYLDARDPAHHQVSDCLDSFSGHLLTTSAVITEAMYFVSPLPEGPSALAQLIVEAEIQVFDLAQPADLLEAATWMAKYADLPMDFADATLVLLAERMEISDILTLDRRGFRVFRGREGKIFRLVLDEE